MFDELFHLLSQLGLGAAARPLCDLILRLAGESLALPQFHQQIQGVLAPFGGQDFADAVISALIETGIAGVSRASYRAESPDEDDNSRPPPGCARLHESPILAAAAQGIVVTPRAGCDRHETARRWLDIDSGIYFDVRQHIERFDPEK